MEKQEKKLSFTFENPNTAEEFEKEFRKLLIDKLSAKQPGIPKA